MSAEASFDNPPIGGCGCDPTTGGGPVFQFNSVWPPNSTGGTAATIGFIIDFIMGVFLFLTVIAILLLMYSNSAANQKFMQFCGISFFILVCIQLVGGKISKNFNSSVST